MTWDAALARPDRSLPLSGLPHLFDFAEPVYSSARSCDHAERNSCGASTPGRSWKTSHQPSKRQSARWSSSGSLGRPRRCRPWWSRRPTARQCSNRCDTRRDPRLVARHRDRRHPASPPASDERFRIHRDESALVFFHYLMAPKRRVVGAMSGWACGWSSGRGRPNNTIAAPMAGPGRPARCWPAVPIA